MSAELIERLRDENARNGGQGHYAWIARELCGKAADLITTQAAEIAELRAAQDAVAGKIADWIEREDRGFFAGDIAKAIRDGDWK